MRVLIAVSAIIVGLAGVLLCALYAFVPVWERGETADTRVVVAEMQTSDALPVEPSYSQKFAYAQEKLEGIAQLSEYLVVVDISEQKEYIFTKSGELLHQYRVSTGASVVPIAGSADDSGPEYQDRSMMESVWKVVSKRDSGLAALYGPRLMLLDRYVSGRWIETEVALHGTDEPENLGRPVSLGCVYHDNADIIQLYDLLPVGTLVVAMM